MTLRDLRIAAVVLAAGAGTRFSGEPGLKLLADLGGLPVLGHVLAALREFAPQRTVVVLGMGHAAIELTIMWAGEERVINPLPERGIASSLKVGFEALLAGDESLDGAFVVLGDQPALRPDVLRSLVQEAARERSAGEDRLALAPQYADEEPGVMNPVLLMRAAWSMAGQLEGDRGLGPLVAGMGRRLRRVDVPGAQPDVDTLADLERLTGRPTTPVQAGDPEG